MIKNVTNVIRLHKEGEPMEYMGGDTAPNEPYVGGDKAEAVDTGHNTGPVSVEAVDIGSDFAVTTDSRLKSFIGACKEVGDVVGRYNGFDVAISKYSRNRSVVFAGSPGSGKSTGIAIIMGPRIECGELVLIIDHHGSCKQNKELEELLLKNRDITTYIRADDIINLPLINESDYDDVRGAALKMTEVFRRCYHITMDQNKYITDAMEESIALVEGKRDLDEYGVSSIIPKLSAVGKVVTQNIIGTIEGSLHEANVHVGDFPRKSGIIVYDLNGFSAEAQRVLISMINCAVLNSGINDNFILNGCTVVLDEAQYIAHDKDSILMETLRILRKKNVSYLIASPERLSDKGSTIHSAAALAGTTLVFNPGNFECARTAKELGVGPAMVSKAAMRLSSLDVGECIGMGDFVSASGDKIPSMVRISMQVKDKEVER